MVARLECLLQTDGGGTTSTGMRQEVDICYVVTSLKGLAQYLYEDVYCQPGQMEKLIKLNIWLCDSVAHHRSRPTHWG